MLTNIQDWQGVWTALITPFTLNGQIDWQAWEKIVAYQMDSGIHGLVLYGSTGEGLTLELDEKLELVKRALQLIKNSKVKLIASVGSSSTKQSSDWAKAIADLGAHGLLVSTSAYNKPTLPGHIDYFKQIAKSNLPICLYHIPGRTAQRLSFEQIEQICNQVPQIKSIKESSGDLQLFANLKHELKNCAILSGDDPAYLASLAIGADGLVSVCSNLLPKQILEIEKQFKTKNLTAASQANAQLLTIYDVMFCESNPGPIKAAMAIRGFCQNTLRSPLAPVSEANYAMIKSAIAKFF